MLKLLHLLGRRICKAPYRSGYRRISNNSSIQDHLISIDFLHIDIEHTVVCLSLHDDGY